MFTRNMYLSMATVLVLAAAMPASAQITRTPTPKIQKLANGDRNIAKLSGGLLLVRQDVKTTGVRTLDAVRKRLPHALRDGKLQVIIGCTQVTPALLSACRAAGIEVMTTHGKHGVNAVVARCTDVSALDTIARRADVRVVTAEPARRTHAGSVTSQADASINADDARAATGADGAGLRLGILSDTFHRIVGGTLTGDVLTGSAPQLSGDLPAQVRILDPGPAFGTDEGAGMAELAYDIAPAAAISFASAFTDYLVFADNITELRTDPGNQCHVICDDVIYYAEPMYQNGPIAIAANDCHANGVPYFSSAGNFGDNGHERPYSDANSGADDPDVPPSGNDLHDFGVAYGQSSDTHIEVTVNPGGLLTVVAHWDEPYGGALGSGPGAEADYDVYIVDSTTLPVPSGSIYASSLDPQGTVGAPLGEPYEVAQYQNTTTGSQTLYVIVDHYDGRKPTALHVLVDVSGGTLQDKPKFADRTIYGHSAAENAMAVAAMFYGEIDDPNHNVVAPPVQRDVEPFSSLGGNLPFWFPDTGTPRFGAAQTRFKPDITGPDGSNTTFFGNDIGFDADAFPNFFGTSAAAPHVAALAVLVKDYNPGFSPAQVYARLQSTAIDSEAAGADFLSGSGQVDALPAVPVQVSAFSVE